MPIDPNTTKKSLPHYHRSFERKDLSLSRSNDAREAVVCLLRRDDFGAPAVKDRRVFKKGRRRLF